MAAATAIFGKESFAGMLAIVNASDADFKKLSDSVNNAAGAAERMAQIKLDNFEVSYLLNPHSRPAIALATRCYRHSRREQRKPPNWFPN